jgi:hypothetical protein
MTKIVEVVEESEQICGLCGRKEPEVCGGLGWLAWGIREEVWIESEVIVGKWARGRHGRRERMV